VVEHVLGACLEPAEKRLDRAEQLVNPEKLSTRMLPGKAWPRNLPTSPGRSLEHPSTSNLHLAPVSSIDNEEVIRTSIVKTVIWIDQATAADPAKMAAIVSSKATPDLAKLRLGTRQ
jgi:hypothetical protein